MEDCRIAGRPVRPSISPLGLGVRLRFLVLLGLPLALLIARVEPRAQGVREHTRPKSSAPSAITPSQATELTLTLTEAAVRPIQVWVRTAGAPGPDGRSLKASLTASEGTLV